MAAAAFIALAALLYQPVTLRMEVLGVNRPLDAIKNIHGKELRAIPDTLIMEDLHYHRPSNLLFGASEEHEQAHVKWDPSMSVFEDPSPVGRGSIVVIEPETFTSTRLSLTNFPGTFHTHGIDIWSPQDDDRSIFIFAVNHLPNPDFYDLDRTDVPKARSQIEPFHHTVGSSEARHLRSIWHPLIRTPNDIYAINQHAIYVTNDHHYREGAMRLVEDVGYQELAPWTDLIHLDLSELELKIPRQRGPKDKVLIGRAAAGVLVLARPSPYPYLQVIESIQLPCTIDNPSYFDDPYILETGRDASGYVLAGLARGGTFPDPSGLDPVMVYLVREDGQRHVKDSARSWSQKLLFQDDGKTIRSASTAVLVAIDPKKNQGRKQAWVVVTGPISKSAIASKVDL